MRITVIAVYVWPAEERMEVDIRIAVVNGLTAEPRERCRQPIARMKGATSRAASTQGR